MQIVTFWHPAGLGLCGGWYQCFTVYYLCITCVFTNENVYVQKACISYVLQLCGPAGAETWRSPNNCLIQLIREFA